MKRSIAELIAELRALDEHEGLEAKRSWSEDADATISSFSNEPGLGGGTLLIGLARTDEPARYDVVGVSNPDRVQNEVATALSSAKFNRPIRPRIWTEVVDGKNVVAIEIAEAPASEKPIYVSKQGTPKGAYRRIGSADVRCSDDDIRMFHQQGIERPYEDSIVADATMDDLDREVLGNYRKGLIDANPATEVRDYSLDELTEALGGARAEGGVLRPTVAGVLLFGKPLALRRLFPMHRIDYINARGVDWIEDSERRYAAVDVRQPLLAAFRRVYQAILDDLPRSVEVHNGSPERVESPTVPEVVIREALVNALCHRDYRVNSPIQVIRYDDRIEFKNAGHSLVNQDALGGAGSIARNPRIADVFREMKLAENKGTGVRVMRREMEKARLAQPMFESDRGNNHFVATLPFSHLLSESQRDWLASLNAGPLSHEESIALVWCRQAGEIRNAALREVTRLDTHKASSLLRGLCDRGLLVAQGGGAATSYVLVEGLGEAAVEAVMPKALELGQGELFKAGAVQDGETHNLEGKTHNLEGKTHNLEDKTHNLADKTGKLAAEKAALLATLPPPLQALLAGPIPRGDDVKPLIASLCAVRAFSRTDLGLLLRRKDAGHLSRLLSALVAEGALEMTVPDKPNAPNQAYRARPRTDR